MAKTLQDMLHFRFDLFTETLEFVDYEMCDYNYAAFDIASYMVTKAGTEYAFCLST